MAAIGASRGDERDLPASEKMGMSFSKMPSSMLRRAALLLVLLPLAAAAAAVVRRRLATAPHDRRDDDAARRHGAQHRAGRRRSPSLLAPNTDPHEYEVRPDDVKALASADVVLRSGGEIDEWLDGALDSAGVDEQDVVDAGAAAGLEGDDPHWWQDPRRAEKAAIAIGARDRRARGCRTTRRAYVAAAAGARRGRAGAAWTRCRRRSGSS